LTSIAKRQKISQPMSSSSDVEQVLQAIYQTIAELNGQLPATQQLAAAPETVLVGEKGQLDSLGLINLLVNLEDVLAAAVGRRIKIFDERLLANAQGPMATVGALAEHVAARL
jgi:acyl carrier protein